MTTGTKRQWARIGLAVAAILLLALCFGLSGPLDRALSYHTANVEGRVVDQAVTQDGRYALVLRRNAGQPYLLLYCSEEQWHRVQPGDYISSRARLSERLNEGTVRELTVLYPAAPSEFSPEFMQNQARANGYYRIIREFFRAASGIGSYDVYPDYYGGAYLDNAGNLVINLVREDTLVGHALSAEEDPNAQALSALVPDGDITFVAVRYSLNELQQAQDTIKGLLRMNEVEFDEGSNLAILKDALTGTCILETNNILVIELRDLTPELETLFRANVFDAPFLLFKQGVYIAW